MKKWLRNLTSEQSTTSKRPRLPTHRHARWWSREWAVWTHSSRFQTDSLLPESFLDSIRRSLFRSFKDVGPGFRDHAWASTERERVCLRVCVRVSGPSVGGLEGRPDGSLCDLSRGCRSVNVTSPDGPAQQQKQITPDIFPNSWFVKVRHYNVTLVRDDVYFRFAVLSKNAVTNSKWDPRLTDPSPYLFHHKAGLYKYCNGIKTFYPWRNTQSPYSDTVPLNEWCHNYTIWRTF